MYPKRRGLAVLENNIAPSIGCPDEEDADVLAGQRGADGVICSAEETAHPKFLQYIYVRFTGFK